MERMEDEVLRLIVERMGESRDRKSFSLVCKRWCRVEGLQRSHLRLLQPHRLANFLPRFPNLVAFESSEVMTEALMELVSTTCPNIQVLNLTRKNSDRGMPDLNDMDLEEGLDDLDYWGLLYHRYDKYGWDAINGYDIGLMARASPNLIKVYLRGRWTIGSYGIMSLVNFAPNLTLLDIGKCYLVGDEVLDDIANAKSLQVLNLDGCSRITDSGLASMAKGYVSGTLRTLVISECDKITDGGLLELSQMRVLEELDLSRCGCKVTDTGGLAIAAALTNLKKLNLSWLTKISNTTLVALAKNCSNLLTLDLTGCETITGDGIRAFATHKSLQKFVLASCYNMDGGNIELTVLGCQTLSHIVLEKGCRMSMPMAMQQNISRTCSLEWQ